MDLTQDATFPALISLIDESVGGMTAHAKRVAAFLLGGGQSVPTVPTMPDSAVRRLRCLLLLEETLEFITSAGFDVDHHFTDFSPPCSVGERFGITVFATGHVPSYEGMVDACADISVVNTGTLIALGAGDERVLEAVDSANLAKVSGGCSKDANGKIRKPEGWTPPRYDCVEWYEEMLEREGPLPSSLVTDDFGEGILTHSVNES